MQDAIQLSNPPATQTPVSLIDRLTQATFLGATALQWIVAAAIVILCALVVMTVRRIMLSRLKAREGAEPASVAAARRLARDLLDSWMALTTAAISLRLGLIVLDPSAQVALWASRAIFIMLAVQGVRWVPIVLDWGIETYVSRHRAASGEPDPALRGAFNTFRWVGLLLLYIALFLLLLQNLGIEITPLIAGLGVGGIAVALAVQNILGDLFASLSITLDKPFVVGDFVVVGNEMGSIERIGLKTTRVRSLSGEQLIFANSDLLNSRIRNFKRMTERRVAFGLSVTYQTPPDVLEAIPGMIRDAIGSQPTRVDRVHLTNLGASAIEFEAVYFVPSPDMTMFRNTHQAIILDVIRRFADAGVQFAYPTQTLHIVNAPTADGAPAGDSAPRSRHP